MNEMRAESIDEILRAMDAAWAQLRLAMNRAKTEELRDQIRGTQTTSRRPWKCLNA